MHRLMLSWRVQFRALRAPAASALKHLREDELTEELQNV
jgi:hypothetical protein